MDRVWHDCTDLIRKTPESQRRALYELIVDGSDCSIGDLQRWIRSPSTAKPEVRTACAHFLSAITEASLSTSNPSESARKNAPEQPVKESQLGKPVSMQSSDQNRQRLSVMSWNVRNLSTGTAAARLLRIASGIVSQSIVALQEVCGNDPMQVLKRIIPKEATFQIECSKRLGDPQRRTEHLAVLYNPEHVDLLSAVTITRNLVYGIFICVFETKQNQRRFTVVNAHVSYGKSVNDRRSEARHLLQHITSILKLPEAAAAGPLILVGDFNVEPDDPVFEELRIRHGYLSLNALAQPTTVGGSAFDNFYVPVTLPGLCQRSWQIVTFDECHGDEAKREFVKNFSDHFAIRMIMYV